MIPFKEMRFQNSNSNEYIETNNSTKNKKRYKKTQPSTKEYSIHARIILSDLVCFINSKTDFVWFSIRCFGDLEWDSSVSSIPQASHWKVHSTRSLQTFIIFSHFFFEEIYLVIHGHHKTQFTITHNQSLWEQALVALSGIDLILGLIFPIFSHLA